MFSRNLNTTFFGFWLALLATLILSAVAWDYCAEHWCAPGHTHVACNNTGSYGSSCTGDAQLMPLGKELSNLIVHRLNFYRNKIASGLIVEFGPAHRMATLQWDPELAKLAEFTVKRCRLQPDECRNTRRFKHVGQTLNHVLFSAFSQSDKQLLIHKIDNWFNEYKHDNNSNFRQLVQERATHVGCGVLQQTQLKWRQQFIVCNFAREQSPGRAVYASSILPATGCKTGANPKYRNLCSINEEFDVNVLDDHLQPVQTQPKLHFKFNYSEDGVPKRSKPKPAEQVFAVSLGL